MSGWKTKAAAIGAMLTGLGLVIKGVVGLVDDDPATGMDEITGGIAAFSGGLGLWGVGHKVEKGAAAIADALAGANAPKPPTD